MKTIKALAWGCVFIIVFDIGKVTWIHNYLDSDNHGLSAALFAANAGAAFLVGLVFNLPAFSHFIPRGLNILTVFLAAASGLMSAFHWMADEVEDPWFRLIMLAPIIIIVAILMWLVVKCTKEETKHEDE